MIENLPDYISWIFSLTTFLTVGFYLYGVWQTGTKAFLLATAAAITTLLVIHAVLAFNGFYLAQTIPPRFLLGPFPTIVILLGLYFIFARNNFSIKALQILTLLSIIRIPVELVLLWLFQHQQIPQLMTFEGRNFDILSGLTAPIVAWLAFRGEKINRPLLIVWNLVALGLVMNIVINAILALETPFQQFAFEEPNRGILFFPFVWLPAIIVPIVFVSHIWSLWQLFRHPPAVDIKY